MKTEALISEAIFTRNFEEGLREAAHREAQNLQDEGFRGIAMMTLSHEEGEPLIAEVEVRYQELIRRHGGYGRSEKLGEELYEYLTSQAYPPGYSYAYVIEVEAQREEVQEITRRMIAVG